MPLLLIVALVLAWPTFGLSIIAWIALAIFRAKTKAEKVDQRRENLAHVAPIFENRYDDFFNVLAVPLQPGSLAMSSVDANRCGQHMAAYIAHNPDELRAFMNAMRRWPTPGGRLCHPATILEVERRIGEQMPLNALAVRAIEAMMERNPGLTCFASVDLTRLRLNEQCHCSQMMRRF